LHGRRDIFVDFANQTSDKEEAEANRFATDYLIPTLAYERFTTRRNYSESAVLQFAREIGVAPGIVVGRLQHDEKIAFNQLNHLRRKVGWSPAGVVRVA
jgi:Zn-dependent peptidase ImmA (M78 family)